MENTKIKDNDYFVITKTVGGRLTIQIVNDETQAVLKVVLTPEQPSKRLPASWAVKIFSTERAYNAYKMGVFTFDRNDELRKLAYETGHYFDSELNFTPTSQDHMSALKAILIRGDSKALGPYMTTDKGKRDIVSVAVANLKDLKVEVVKYIEEQLKVQLTTDGE
jgi:hypothetical protein